MCILFLELCDSPGPDGFRLILASNRDEHYRRPTDRAHHWKEAPSVFGGQSGWRRQCLEPGPVPVDRGSSRSMFVVRGRYRALAACTPDTSPSLAPAPYGNRAET